MLEICLCSGSLATENIAALRGPEPVSPARDGARVERGHGPLAFGSAPRGFLGACAVGFHNQQDSPMLRSLPARLRRFYPELPLLSVAGDLCLLKNPSAAEILAFGRIGVRSGHA